MAQLGFSVSSDPNRGVVHAYSNWHLPYEPRTEAHADFARELREHLGRLTPSGSLRAAYFSKDDVLPCDLENVLFYNLKGGFSRLASDYVRFGFRPLPQDRRWRNHATYEVVSSASTEPLFGSMIAKSSFDCPGNVVDDVAALWRLFKTHTELSDHARAAPGPFGLQLHLSGSYQNGAATLLKKPIDAFCSALHRYQGRDLVEVTRRLASKLKLEQVTVRTLLMGDGLAILGPKNSPILRGAGLQWSPDDDRLQEVEIIRDRTGPERLEATLFC